MRFIRWLLVLAYVGFIYITLPIAPRIWIRAQRRLGTSFASLAFYPLVFAALVILIYAIYRTRGHWLSLLGLAGAGVAYYYLYNHEFQTPAERMHFLEYGLLSWIIYWALQPSVSRWTRVAAGAFFLSCVFGSLDEYIQYLTFERWHRVGELRDAVANWESALLGMIVLLLIIRPWKKEREQ
ncbi:MAG TPA: VanZ family protein [Acidobacteriota bacterium]|jgi:VanZ family protein